MRMRFFLLMVLAAGCVTASPVTIKVECDHPDAVYRTGEEVVFSLTAVDGRGAKVGAGRFRAWLDNFGPVEIVPRRDYDFAESNPVVIRGRMSEPGFLRLGMNMPGVTNIVWSVAVSPEGIRPGAPCPKDFDAFWSRAIARYDAEVAEDVELAPQPALSTPELDVFKVTLSAIGGRRIYGILSRPKDLSKGPFPLRFGGKGAGSSSFGRCGRPGQVTLEMNVHYYDAPAGSSKKDNAERQKRENDEWARRYPAKHAEYQLLGIAAGREDYFYYGVILATRRAFKWAARQPYVDAHDIAYSSTSQGGAFGLYMTALCPEIGRLVACVPAMTDLCGFKAGRMSGWPRLIEAQLDDRKTVAASNAPYFDAANFARRVKCPVRFVVGFSDTTCPPAAVYAAYNNLASSDKAIIHGIGMTHLVRREYYDELDAWLDRKDCPSGLKFEVRPSRADGVYAAGEEAVLTVTAADADGRRPKRGHVTVVLDNYGRREISRRTVDLARENPFVVKALWTTAGCVRMRLEANGKEKGAWGIAFDPEKICVGCGKPDDFDRFWAEAKAKYDREVPVDVRLERLEALDDAKCIAYRLSLTSPHGKTVDGILSEPRDLSRGPYPVMLSVPGAGPSYGCVRESSDRRIGLTMNVHYYPLVPGQHEHSASNAELRARWDVETAECRRKFGARIYWLSGAAVSREDYHYYDCILAINRAIDWLWARPEVKKDDIRYFGVSQGGGMGLILTGLNEHIVRTGVLVPALTDLFGFLDGERRSGWPQLVENLPAERQDAIVANARYFDAAHFASRIRTPIRIGVGLSDPACPPAAVWAGYNAIPAEDKGIVPGFGMTHTPSKSVRNRVIEWLERPLEGGR